MAELAGPGPAEKVRGALADFERLQCPGVPTVIAKGQRFFGKDRRLARRYLPCRRVSPSPSLQRVVLAPGIARTIFPQPGRFVPGEIAALRSQ
jgi:hypothetical protein